MNTQADVRLSSPMAQAQQLVVGRSSLPSALDLIDVHCDGRLPIYEPSHPSSGTAFDDGSDVSETVNSRGSRLLLNEAADDALGFVRGGAHAYARILGQRNWQPHPTPFDSWHYGVLVDPVGRQILTYAACERLLVTCKDDVGFQGELRRLATFYGDSADGAATGKHRSLQ